MPNARQVETNEPAHGQIYSSREDLSLLLSEIHASRIGKLNSLHGRGTVLFAEGEPARGVYILRSGRVTVSISSSAGRVVMLRVAQSGDVLGLNSVFRNSFYDTTVKTLEPCRTDFISRMELFNIMQHSSAGAYAILRMLSQELTELTDRAKSLLLPETVNGRLARLLLELSNGTTRLARVLTHEEIAQMICSSRETVTRLLATLSRQKVICVTPDTILIHDRPALEAIT
ncbi:MAG TPA: Crp/Fnr family transcriptional regulator [Pyrinomonadaceae bacterium]